MFIYIFLSYWNHQLRQLNIFNNYLLTIICIISCRGADPNATDRNGKTPLQYAVESGTIDDEEILVLLDDPNR